MAARRRRGEIDPFCDSQSGSNSICDIPIQSAMVLFPAKQAAAHTP